MKFYKWKAYDFNTSYYTGVMECESHVEVAFNLAKQNLVPKEIIPISYEEYRRVKTGYDRIVKMKRKRDAIFRRLNPPAKHKPRYVLISAIALAIVSIIVLLIVLVSNANLQNFHRF